MYTLAGDTVHVWRVGLDVAGAYLDHLQASLSPDEHARAARFHARQDRARFIAARGFFRVILGRYLAREPGRLRFSYNAYGKPALIPEYGDRQLHVSVSHSHAVALYAITYYGAVGIDLEHIQPDFPYRRIAERFFSPHEVAALFALPAAQQQRAFFVCWTRKEAYVKARGDGLSLPLDRFDVSLSPDEPPALLRVHGDDDEAYRWSLHQLPPAHGYVAALAIKGQGCRLRCYAEPTVREHPRS